MLVIFILIIISFYIFKINNNKTNLSAEDIQSEINNDIINPKFTLRNKKEVINITADSGNFISSDLILLKKNVKFNSTNFKIFSNEVLINNIKQTAKSDQSAKFVSNNTEIIAEGFDISEAGNKIKFNGKTKITLNK